MGKLNVFVTGAAIGCAAGALAALALAPQSGAETRRLVTERVGGLMEDTKDFNTGATAYAQKHGGNLIGTVQEKVGAIAGKVRPKSDEAPGAIGNSASDDLREKIAAARERIAKQVEENAKQAEQAAEAVADKAEEAAEAAKEAAEE